jgi:hypothetical protein
MESKNKIENNEQLYLEEILRQISMQSAIIAGFSFAGLTLDSSVDSSNANLFFTLFVGIAMGLEILALVTSGMLLSAFKYNPTMKVKWKSHFDICWGSYLFGLFGFLISLPFIVYIRMPKLIFPASLFTILVLIVVSNQFNKIFKKTK